MHQQIDLSDSVLEQVSVHFVGNKGNGDELILSQKPLILSDTEKRIMRTSFLSKFDVSTNRYCFSHLSSLNYHEVYNFCLGIFADTDTFHGFTAKLAKLLYECTLHPKIKQGELYVCLYSNCLVNGAYMEAIGIFKTETKSNFIGLDINDEEFSIKVEEGVEISRFDKGCLIFPSNAEQGFDVFIYDTDKSEGATFWKEAFLAVAPQANEYYHTNHFLAMTKQFIARQLPQELEISKVDQVDLLNKSAEYFRANDTYDIDSFKSTVLVDPRIINAFGNFEASYIEANDVDIPTGFHISTPALKKQVKQFKSVIKLDKNFHIYMHGDRELIQRGYDEQTGKNYYKIFFDEES